MRAGRKPRNVQTISAYRWLMFTCGVSQSYNIRKRKKRRARLWWDKAKRGHVRGHVRVLSHGTEFYPGREALAAASRPTKLTKLSALRGPTCESVFHPPPPPHLSSRQAASALHLMRDMGELIRINLQARTTVVDVVERGQDGRPNLPPPPRRKRQSIRPYHPPVQSTAQPLARDTQRTLIATLADGFRRFHATSSKIA